MKPMSNRRLLLWAGLAWAAAILALSGAWAFVKPSFVHGQRPLAPIPWSSVVDLVVAAHRDVAACANVELYDVGAWDAKIKGLRPSSLPFRREAMRSDAGSRVCFDVHIALVESDGDAHRVYVEFTSNTAWPGGGSGMLRVDCSDGGCRTVQSEWRTIVY